MKPRNDKLKSFSQNLRKNMTKEEKHLWYDFLKKLPVVIKRQEVIGDYIVDFFCHSANLVIEIDGSQHYEPDAQAQDKARDEYLNALGFTVLRYSNHDIKTRFNSVCNDIMKYLPSSVTA